MNGGFTTKVSCLGYPQNLMTFRPVQVGITKTKAGSVGRTGWGRSSRKMLREASTAYEAKEREIANDYSEMQGLLLMTLRL